MQQQEVQQEGCDAQEPELNENKEWETNATVTDEESDQQNPEEVVRMMMMMERIITDFII